MPGLPVVAVHWDLALVIGFVKCDLDIDPGFGFSSNLDSISVVGLLKDTANVSPLLHPLAVFSSVRDLEGDNRYLDVVSVNFPGFGPFAGVGLPVSISLFMRSCLSISPG